MVLYIHDKAPIPSMNEVEIGYTNITTKEKVLGVGENRHIKT